jgi:hypothetical protein
MRALRRARPNRTVDAPREVDAEKLLLEEADGVLHVLNAPSPGATASLAIGRMLAEWATAGFGL